MALDPDLDTVTMDIQRNSQANIHLSAKGLLTGDRKKEKKIVA